MISTPAFRPPFVSLLASLWLTGPLHWPRAELMLNVLCFTSVHVSCGARCFDRLWTLTFASAPAVAGRILTCWPSHFAYRLSCWLVRPWDKGSINGKSLLEPGFLRSAQLSACGYPYYSQSLYRRSLVVTDLYRRSLLVTDLHRRSLLVTDLHRRCLLVTDLHRRSLLVTDLYRRSLLVTDLYRRSLLVTDLYRRFLLHSVLEGYPVAGAMQHNTTQHNATQHNTIQCNITQHNAMQHNTIQHNTPQYNAT